MRGKKWATAFGERLNVIDDSTRVAAGIHDADNLTGACRSCNARKWTRSLLQFMLAQQTKAVPDAA